ncbi:hypothetical protein E1295_37885, partial [Nonomuraea mesophila]
MTYRQESLPATFAQQGMWIGARMGAGPAYHMPLALWLSGDLDVAAMLAACADVVARHPVLATTVVRDHDGLRLAPAAEPPVTVAGPAGPDALDRLVADEIARPFDLEKGPTARFTLAPAGPARHLLLFVAHHLVFDGMSKDILVRDLARCYAARRDGDDPRLRPLSFAEAIAAEHERVAGALPAAKEFWARRPAEPGRIVLPGPLRPAPRFGAGVEIDLGVDSELGGHAAEVARAAGATTFEVLLAAVHALLFRYGSGDGTDNGSATGSGSGAVDGAGNGAGSGGGGGAGAVAVAIDVTTRGPGTREHIGPFVTELPVSSRPAAEQTFRQHVGAVRAELRELYRFREVPPALALGGPPAALPVSISYRRREAAPEPEFPGLEVTVDRMMFAGGSRNALHLQVVDGPDGPAVSLRLDPAALDRDTATRFAGGLRALLRHAAGNPGVRLADLDVLPGDERRLMLTGWNDTAAAYPAGATLLGLFAAQVDARPDGPAVTFEGRSLTYAELDAASDRLAHRLRQAGVERGELVAVHLPPSAVLPVCLLAVQKAGATYLPLDPGHPEERLSMIVADARPRLLLSDTTAAGYLPAPVLVVGEEHGSAVTGGRRTALPDPGD